MAEEVHKARLATLAARAAAATRAAAAAAATHAAAAAATVRRGGVHHDHGLRRHAVCGRAGQQAERTRR